MLMFQPSKKFGINSVGVVADCARNTSTSCVKTMHEISRITAFEYFDQVKCLVLRIVVNGTFIL